jgi:hypothetical protein
MHLLIQLAALAPVMNIFIPIPFYVHRVDAQPHVFREEILVPSFL